MPDLVVASKSIVVYSQMGAAIDAIISAHWSKPDVRSAKPGEVPWDLAPDVDMVLARPFEIWPLAPSARPATWPGSLKWVLSGSTGVDQYPRWLFDGVPVSCGRGVNADPIAEYVIGAILRHEKRYDAIRMRGPEDYRRFELGIIEGRVIGLAGFGSLGQAIATRARAFGMTILAFRRSAWTDVPDGIEPVATIGELAARADHLVLALPSTSETRHIVNADVLARAKPGQHVINIARGALIDDDALIAALDAGILSAATLDVTAPEPLPAGHPFYTHPKVLITPHVSWYSATTATRTAEKFLGEIERVLKGEPLADLVDPLRGY